MSRIGAERRILLEFSFGLVWMGSGISAACLCCMMTAFFIFAALVAAGFFTEIIATNHAPLGYQDEKGFHFGPEFMSGKQSFDLENPS